MVRFKAWFLLFRPWSYAATLVPFLIGGAWASHANPDCAVGSASRWAFGLLAGILFQAVVNLLNTWGDERSGVDGVPGAIRTTPQVHDGLVSLRAVLAAAIVCAVLAVAIGLALCFYEVPPWCYRNVDAPEAPGTAFCWTLFVVGILGALGATNYSTGIRFKYRGLGVPFVSFLMGPLEIVAAFATAQPYLADRLAGRFLFVVLSCPLAALALLPLVAIVFLPTAALVGVIMHGNDMRDIPTDRAAGIRTLASWLGPRRALAYYFCCHIGAYVPVALQACFWRSFAGSSANPWHGLWFLLPLLALPLSIATLRKATAVYRACPENPPWRGLERGSGGIHLAFGILYALAVLLAW